MKKLAFSLICVNAFASSFVGLDIYGSRVAEENGVNLDDSFAGRADLYVNKFYTNEESHFVYDVRFTHTEFDSDFDMYVNLQKINGRIKANFNSFSALGGYGMLLGNDVSLSFLAGFGYASRNYKAKYYNTIIDKSNDSNNSMLLKTAVAARKQFENNFTMSGGVYLKYYFNNIIDEKLISEFDISLGYTFANNIYTGLKIAYVHDIVKGGSAGLALSYKF